MGDVQQDDDMFHGLSPAAVANFKLSWGDPIIFEWRPEQQKWFCKLCWKYADDTHTACEKHQKNLKWYLLEPGRSIIKTLPQHIVRPLHP